MVSNLVFAVSQPPSSAVLENAANHSVNGNFTVTISKVKSDSPNGQAVSSIGDFSHETFFANRLILKLN
jgi:hypothetical protein